jgi:transglutaminase-like putative cysteine protease
MKIHPSRYPLLGIILCLFASFPVAIRAAGDEWKPIDPAHLALKSSTVEKEADAEGLFWEVRIDDNPEGDLIFNHYLRVKVFTERGRESQSKIELRFGRLYGSETKIKDIAARTIKPDGSIVELKKEDIYERTVVSGSGLKYKAKSFAMPAIEVGCIIEYRWREVRVNADAHYMRLQFQLNIPVQLVKYSIKPMNYPDASFHGITLHGQASQWVKEKGGFYSTTMTNMPAVHEESRMPPEDEIKTWILVYYQKASSEKPNADKYWLDLGRDYYERTKSLLKANDEVKQMAVSLTEGAKTDEEKIANLFDFCRYKIKNTSNDASGLTSEERAKLKDNKTPSDTLKRGMGTGGDIDLLFAALANAAGLDARIVLAPDRGDIFFDKSLPNAYFVRPQNIAVNIGGTWKFFNPGYNYIPFGMLRWQEEGQQSLVTDPKNPVWVSTPMSSHEKSLVKRTAKLKLADDGTLEGDVRVEYTGHFAIERKEEMDEESETQREENLRGGIKYQMSTAEITNVKIENVTDHVKPLVISYHLRLPGYAQRTGKRLFLQPAFFQHGLKPLFATASRKYPIYFHYPWSESDQVEFELPKGYALDNADAPAGFGSNEISQYKPSLATNADGSLLVYKRSFFFGGGGAVLYPVEAYGGIKNYFDAVHKQDSHSIALKQTATN